MLFVFGKLPAPHNVTSCPRPLNSAYWLNCRICSIFSGGRFSSFFIFKKSESPLGNRYAKPSLRAFVW